MDPSPLSTAKDSALSRRSANNSPKKNTLSFVFVVGWRLCSISMYRRRCPLSASLCRRWGNNSPKKKKLITVSRSRRSPYVTGAVLCLADLSLSPVRKQFTKKKKQLITVSVSRRSPCVLVGALLCLAGHGIFFHRATRRRIVYLHNRENSFW